MSVPQNILSIVNEEGMTNSQILHRLKIRFHYELRPESLRKVLGELVRSGELSTKREGKYLLYYQKKR